MLAEGIRSIVEIKFSVGIIEQKQKGDIRSSATSEADLFVWPRVEASLFFEWFQVIPGLHSPERCVSLLFQIV